MSDKQNYAIWRPEYDGHAPPNWRGGMKWEIADFPSSYDASGIPGWSPVDVYHVEPEALNSPNDDARDGKPTDPRKSVHEALAILRNYSPDELTKHGITLAEPKDWATELWADLFAVRGIPSAAKSTREGRLDDEDRAAIALIRERVVLKGEG